MDASNINGGDRPTKHEIDAAAYELHRWGELHRWWPEGAASLEAMDSIGRDEFEAIVERVLIAAAAARRSLAADRP